MKNFASSFSLFVLFLSLYTDGIASPPSIIKEIQNQNLTMLSPSRLHWLWLCMEDVEQNNISGDFIETGVWKGGATILMRAFLKTKEDKNRNVWVADSFQGFPDTARANELNCNNTVYPYIIVSSDEVKNNFRKFNLLDNQVCFLEGFFKDTLPNAPISELAILRLDGDLYESTMDALTNLYPKLSIGGYVIIDDYGYWPGCRDAVEDFRQANDITNEIIWEDDTGVHWKKTN